MAMLRLLGSGSTPHHRIRVAFDFALAGRKEIDGMITGHARLARALGEELGLDEQVLAALGASYERWDGKGFPGELSGADIPMRSRIVQLAEFAEVAHRTHGIEGAQALARRRSASPFDPDLVAMLCEDAEKVFHDLDELGSWEPVIAAEPSLAVLLSPVELDAALEAVATFVDLKSPYRLGHSVAVADLTAEAGRRVGLPAEDRRSLRRAGLVLGFGRPGVSNSTWDQAGPLSAGQCERVRLHPQITERMLNQSPALAPLGRLAGHVASGSTAPATRGERTAPRSRLPGGSSRPPTSTRRSANQGRTAKPGPPQTPQPISGVRSRPAGSTIGRPRPSLLPRGTG